MGERLASPGAGTSMLPSDVPFSGHRSSFLTPSLFQPINTKDGVTDTYAKV
jgi:hypothetical protein